ncbi:MAG: hypothetical protein ABI175_20910, partial [Polyangiales bacterium]
SAYTHFLELARAVDDADDPAKKPWAALARAEAKELEPRVGHLSIHVMSADVEAKVWVDDELLKPAALDVEFVVDPGVHRARLVRAGKPDLTVEVTIAEGEHRKLTLAETAAAPLPPPVTVVPPQPTPETPRATPRLVPKLLIAVGGAAIVTGLAFGYVALRKRGSACDSDLVCDPDGLNEARTYARVSTVATGLGLGVAASGLIWLLLSPASDRGPVASVTVLPSAVSVAGTFYF